MAMLPDLGETGMSHAYMLTDANETDEACMIFPTQVVGISGSTMPTLGFPMTLIFYSRFEMKL